MRVSRQTDPAAEVDVPDGRVPGDRRRVPLSRFRLARYSGENDQHHTENQEIWKLTSEDNFWFNFFCRLILMVTNKITVPLTWLKSTFMFKIKVLK